MRLGRYECMAAWESGRCRIIFQYAALDGSHRPNGRKCRRCSRRFIQRPETPAHKESHFSTPDSIDSVRVRYGPDAMPVAAQGWVRAFLGVRRRLIFCSPLRPSRASLLEGRVVVDVRGRRRLVLTFAGQCGSQGLCFTDECRSSSKT